MQFPLVQASRPAQPGEWLEGADVRVVVPLPNEDAAEESRALAWASAVPAAVAAVSTANSPLYVLDTLPPPPPAPSPLPPSPFPSPVTLPPCSPPLAGRFVRSQQSPALSALFWFGCTVGDCFVQSRTPPTQMVTLFPCCPLPSVSAFRPRPHLLRPPPHLRPQLRLRSSLRRLPRAPGPRLRPELPLLPRLLPIPRPYHPP